MYNLNRRLGKIEKQFGVGQKPYPVNIGGLEMTSADLDKLLKEIRVESKELPIKEYQAKEQLKGQGNA